MDALNIQLYSLSLIVFLVFLYATYTLQKKVDESKISQTLLLTVGSILAWCAYVNVIVQSGLLPNFNIPFFPILLLFPLIVIYIVFYRAFRNSDIINNASLFNLTLFQSFRIFVEILLYQIAALSIVPDTATFDGLNFDIVLGASAIAMALLFRSGKISVKVLRIWNVLGILMIGFVVFIIGSSMYIPQIWGSETRLVDGEFLQYPYILVASFLAPMGIFVHVVSLARLSHKS